MSIAKNVTVCAIAAGALMAAGAAFVPGTAEAHCGGHQGTCGQGNYVIGTYCQSGHLMFINGVYDNNCTAPASGCSGSACLSWPCAAGACQDTMLVGPNSCYLYQYDYDSGQNCGS